MSEQEMNDKGFQERISQIIYRVGGVEELSRRAGINSRAIHNYKKGESDPSRRRVVAMAKAAGVSIEWLTEGTGEENPLIRNKRPDKDTDLIRVSEIQEAMKAIVETLKAGETLWPPEKIVKAAIFVCTPDTDEQEPFSLELIRVKAQRLVGFESE